MSNDLFSMMNAPVSPATSATSPFQTNFSPFGIQQQQGMSSQYGQQPQLQQPPFGLPMGMQPQYNQQMPRAAPIPPMTSPHPTAVAAPSANPNKVQTNAFDDLFN